MKKIIKKNNNKIAKAEEKPSFKTHFIKYKQPYLMGVGMVLWFILLIFLATIGQTLPYNSIAVDLGGFSIAWYAVFILTGIIFAVIIGYRESFFLDINRENLIDGALIGVVVSVIGARLYYVAFQSVGGFKEIFNLRGGGLAIHGGIIAGLTFTVIYTKIKKMDLYKLLDIVAIGFLVGQIVGRWGNFFNQEAHGGPMSQNAQNFLSIILPSFVYKNMEIGGVFYHPTFLYESLWNLLGLILLLIIRRKKLFKTGDMIGLYLIWYGLGRGLLIEPFRTDPLLFIESAGGANIFNRVNVVLSLTLFTIGGALFIIIKNKLKPDLPYYLDVVKGNEQEALYLLSKEGRQEKKNIKRKNKE